MTASFDTNIQKNEGKTTTMIEEQTSKVPSVAYLGLAVGSMAASLGFMIAGKKQIANFVGQWAPALLMLGLYNKIVKLEDELLGLRGPRGPQGRLIQTPGSGGF
jgi:hypothetical protein